MEEMDRHLLTRVSPVFVFCSPQITAMFPASTESTGCSRSLKGVNSLIPISFSSRLVFSRGAPLLIVPL